MFKKIRTVIFSILILSILLLLCIQQWTAGLKDIAGTLLLPVTYIANGICDIGKKVTYYFLSHEDLLKANQVLSTQVETNKLISLRLKELENENGRLRQALGFKQNSPWELKLARVIGREPSNWWKMILINAGSNDGIKVNQTVLATTGEASLIGRVYQVSKFESRVVLLGDPNCLASVTVGDNSCLGMIEPLNTGSIDPGVVKLAHLSGAQTLIPGTKIYTSGMGGIFPEGIYIGILEENINEEYGIQREGKVRLAADGVSLDEVWVLLR